MSAFGKSKVSFEQPESGRKADEPVERNTYAIGASAGNNNRYDRWTSSSKEATGWVTPATRASVSTGAGIGWRRVFTENEMLTALNNDNTPIANTSLEDTEPTANQPASLSVSCETNSKASSAPRKRRKSTAKLASMEEANNPVANLQPTAGLSPKAASQTKAALVLNLLRREDGTSLSEIMAITAWQVHSVRGFLSGTVRKKLRLNLISEVTGDGIRRYRIDGSGALAEASEPIELPPFGSFKGAPTVEQPATEPEV